MSPDLAIGATAEASWIVRESDLASELSDEHSGSFPPVFSTARMVALMELAAARTLAGILQPGELSVGVLVDVTHTAATPPGGSVPTRRGRRCRRKLPAWTSRSRWPAPTTHWRRH